MTFILSSAFALNLDQSNILLFGKVCFFFFFFFFWGGGGGGGGGKSGGVSLKLGIMWLMG